MKSSDATGNPQPNLFPYQTYLCSWNQPCESGLADDWQEVLIDVFARFTIVVGYKRVDQDGDIVGGSLAHTCRFGLGGQFFCCQRHLLLKRASGLLAEKITSTFALVLLCVEELIFQYKENV